MSTYNLSSILHKARELKEDVEERRIEAIASHLDLVKRNFSNPRIPSFVRLMNLGLFYMYHPSIIASHLRQEASRFGICRPSRYYL